MEYFIAPSFKKTGCGTDFYSDLHVYAKKNNFTLINTMRFGKILLPFYEIIVLCLLPKHSTIVTTWPGFPYQYLVCPCIVNAIRFRVFSLLLRLKKCNYVLVPIDRPLEQYAYRLSQKKIKIEGLVESRLFSSVSIFLCCGAEMTKIYSNKYPLATCVQFDMYDQILPDASTQNSASKPKKPLKIAVSGNLSRMLTAAKGLPKIHGVRYVFTGPGGDSLSELSRSDFEVLGNVPSDKLLEYLSNVHFGLVLYDDKVSEYFSTVMAGKLTTYLRAGIPILCHAKYESMAEYVSRSGTGLVINSYNDITRKMNLAKEMLEMRKKAIYESERIKEGAHYKEAFMKMKKYLS